MGHIPAPDVVTASVAAYTEHVADYAAYNADAMADAAARFLTQLDPESRILDAGCGPGRDLARFSAAGHHPVGVDLNPAFVAVATASAPAQLGDLRDLPFADDAFDATWACASLVHLPPTDAAMALGELARVTKPGGLVCVSVKHAGQTGWTDTAHGRRWFHIWQPDTFCQAVRDAGLTVSDDAVEVGAVFVDVWARA